MDKRTVWADGARIRQWRLQKGWSQEELADRAGVAKRTVETLENNRHAVLLHTLRVVAEALDVMLPELLAVRRGAEQPAAPAGPLARADGLLCHQGQRVAQCPDQSVALEVELRLPVTGEYLIGRAREIARLDSAWSGTRVNILSVVAWGGNREVRVGQSLVGTTGARRLAGS
jgi:transcriptional regulator with XRE-family HTH domain